MDNHYADASMGIRKPITEVFEAFINPEITTKFWFTGSTSPLIKGKSLHWEWSMYNLTIPVHVIKIENNALIHIEWGDGDQKSTVEWKFKPVTETLTHVTIKNYGFKVEGDQLISQIRDSTGGFNILLCGLKAYLEHGIELNLTDDKWPAEMR